MIGLKRAALSGTCMLQDGAAYLNTEMGSVRQEIEMLDKC